MRKKQIVISFVDSSNLEGIVKKSVFALNKQYNNCFILNIIPLHDLDDSTKKDTLLKQITNSNLVLVDIRGNNPLIKDILTATRAGKATVATLLGGSFDFMSLTRMGIFDANKFFNSKIAKKKMSGSVSGFDGDVTPIQEMLKEKLPGFIYKDIGAWFDVTKYWSENGQENISRMILMLAKNYCKATWLPKPLPPIIFPSPCIRHPDMEKIYLNLSEYQKEYGWDFNKNSAVLLYYNGMHYESCIVPVRALIKKLEPDMNVIPICCDGIKNIDAVRKLAFINEKFAGDVLFHITWFRMDGGPLGGKHISTYQLLNEINVPVYHPVTLFTSSIEEWEKSTQGVKPIDYLANVVLPEIDGSIEPIVICGTVQTETGNEVCIIDDRIKRLVSRAKKMAELKKKPNADKKIALIFYNYPPGEHNLGDAAFLDTFASIKNILIELKKQGYTVGEIPEQLNKEFINKNIVNSPQWNITSSGERITTDTYLKLMEDVPDFLKQIEDTWGKAPGNIQTDSGNIIFPSIKLGNITIALQPSRGVHEDEEKAYHDKNLPPHHQYAAFYRWLNQIEQVDAIIHVGTHGTFEFLRGKELGVSSKCDMDILLENVPHFYLYQTGNPSEAMIAKRRALASLISYATPCAVNSDLYGSYLEMLELYDELEEAEKLNPQRIDIIEENIRNLAEEQHWSDLEGNLLKIQSRLIDMMRSIIPQGLHTIGIPYSMEETNSYICSVLRVGRADVGSLYKILAEENGENYDQILNSNDKKLLELDIKVKNMVKHWLSESMEPEEKYLPIYNYVKQIQQKVNTNYELDSLINALNAGHISAGLSADAVKNPEVFPSGTNLYQFNPLNIPTKSAIVRGRKIAENTLKCYKKQHGTYPTSTGVILWGFETAKTCGETIGQIFDYIGVRLKTESGTWFPEIELIPIQEMNHPRVDTTVQICGFFRDMFPYAMDLIDSAVHLAATADEEPEQNPIRQKCKENATKLESQGFDKLTAEELATLRIFGPKSSEYGTRVTTIIENASWTDESELGNAYANDMSYAYSKNQHGIRQPEVLNMLLGEIDMVSQVQDTFEYEVTDLDHYYEFFGGFSRAIENASGKKPDMIATNTSTEKIKTEDISLAIARGASTRLFNPKWIDGMLEHSYHGAQKIANHIQYQIGLSATTGKVDPWIWEQTANTFVFDDTMRKRLEENNPYALYEIEKRMLEAKNRGYWNASQEEVEELTRLLLEEEGSLEDK